MSVRSNIGTLATNEDLNTVNTQLTTQITTINTNINAINERINNIPTGGGGSGSDYTHPLYTAASSHLYKITVDTLGHVSATTAVNKQDIINLGIPAQDTTYSKATRDADGLMSKDDKIKLNDIDDHANNYLLPTAGTNTLGGVKTTSTYTLSDMTTMSYSVCPIVNGVVYYRDTDTTYKEATTIKSGLMSNDDKTKLDNVLNLYTGTTEPSNEMGNDGDIYLMILTDNSSSDGESTAE